MAECSVWGVFYFCGRVLCLTGFILVWQSALSGGYFTTVAECSVWGVFYYCGRVLCLEVFYFCGRVLCLGGTLLAWQSTLSGGILLVWQSALSEGYFTSVAECSVKPVSVGTQSVHSPLIQCQSAIL